MKRPPPPGPPGSGGGGGGKRKRAPTDAASRPSPRAPPQPSPQPPPHQSPQQPPPPAQLADAWASFAASRAALCAELATIDLVVYKNHSQHRRTRYWQALRRGHKEAGRLAAGLRPLGERDFAATVAPAGGGARPAAAATTAARARLRAAAAASAAQAAKLLACARVLTAQQTGGGFAALLAVLTGSLAQYVYLALRLRDAVAAALGGGVGDVGAAAR